MIITPYIQSTPQNYAAIQTIEDLKLKNPYTRAGLNTDIAEVEGKKYDLKTIKPLVISINGDVKYESMPKQSLFHWLIEHRAENGFTDFLFGGAAGPGKSTGLRWQAHYEGLRYHELKILLIRTSFAELEKTHLLKIRTDLPREIIRYNEGKKRVIYKPTNSILQFGYGDHIRDMEQYLSSEWDIILLDEETTIPFEFTIAIGSRLRTTRGGFIPYLAGATNPGSIAHRHVKSYYIDKDFDKEFPDMASEYFPETACFIPARIWDNPKVTENDPGYIKRLKRMNALDRKRFLEGSWDIFEGQFFKIFNRDVHCIDEFEVPETWKTLFGMDYGDMTIAERTFLNEKTKTFYAFGEWFEIGLEGKEKARSYKRWLRDLGMLNALTVSDTNMFSKLKEYGMNLPMSAQYFRSEGLRIECISKKKGSLGWNMSDSKKFRVSCNRYIKDLLDYRLDNNGMFIKRPHLFVSKKNKHLIRAFVELQTDKNNDEDYEVPKILSSKKIDNPYDGLKHGILALTDSRYISTSPEEQKRAAEEIEERGRNRYV